MRRFLCCVALAACGYPPLPDEPPTLELLAGTLGGPGNLDGAGSAARFWSPQAVALDQTTGILYVADAGNDTVRKVTPSGDVTTLAGTANVVGSANGTGAAARFDGPEGVAVDDSGNVYVADSFNDMIRKITPSGTVTTLAGLAESSGSADGTGTGARFNLPQGVAVDRSGNVYVADHGNNTIRKITPSGVVSTLAGTAGVKGSANGTGAAASFDGPQGVAVDDSGNVYVADTINATIRKITPSGVVTTLAGTAGVLGSANGTGAAARFGGPQGMAVDDSGNVYVADTFNNMIRKITPSGVVTTLAGTTMGSLDGTGAVAQFAVPGGVAVGSAGDVYVADTGNDTIRKIAAGGGVTTLAGLAGATGSVDGNGSVARFDSPEGLAVDAAGNLYIVDTGNDLIRKATFSGTGTAVVVTTVAGTAGVFGSKDGTVSAAQFGTPEGIAVDGAGNVYVADTLNQTIRKIVPSGLVTTLAGTAQSGGSADGLGPAARFGFPHGLAADRTGNVYVADTDSGTIRQITPSGMVTTLAGMAGSFGDNDGTGMSARFERPSGVAVDSTGTIYVADSSMIRKITAGAVQTLADAVLSSDPQLDVLVKDLLSIAVDGAGNMYVANFQNATIRKVTSSGVVTTIAGVPGPRGIVLGDAPRLGFPTALAVVGDSLVIADTSAILLLRHGAR